MTVSIDPFDVMQFLAWMGEDPSREGLRDTPKRFLAAWRFWTSGYGQSPADILKTFEDGACDEMVFVGQIPLWSMCEHHLSPFFGVAHVGYIPNGKIVGLSKLARLTDLFARRLQVQERMTVQIADALMQHVSPKGVGVTLHCRHTCMESRGIQKAGSTTQTCALRGVFKDEPEVRNEYQHRIEISGQCNV